MKQIADWEAQELAAKDDRCGRPDWKAAGLPEPPPQWCVGQSHTREWAMFHLATGSRGARQQVRNCEDMPYAIAAMHAELDHLQKAEAYIQMRKSKVRRAIIDAESPV